jgi:valyl-tRNA synthetase
MPPPNITGKLHIGHSLFLTIQDSLIRYYRKSGYETNWIAGLDHAGLATHEKIIKSLKKRDYTEEEYDFHAGKIKEKHSNKIIEQIKKMGASCEWEDINYTLNDNFKTAAFEALKKLNDNNFIYEKDGDIYISMKSFADDLLRDIKNNEFIINDITQLNKLIYTLENIEDWCISRNIRWGMKIPIYFNNSDIHILKDNELNYEDRNFTFDTWFTSSLYPLAILNWKMDDDSKFERYYPTQMIETGYDILFPWCARMLMLCKFLTDKYPFKEMYLHGICRDKDGIKMSKSLGNGIDPLDIIDKYGTDALRYSLINKSKGKDMKIDEEDFLNSSRFINKIYQSFRFINMHLEKNDLMPNPIKKGNYEDECNKIKDEFIEAMEKRDFINISTKLQYSYKHNFCDKWIEDNKKEIFAGNAETIQHGLYILLFYMNIMHCFIPFISEFIYKHFGYEDIIDKKY